MLDSLKDPETGQIKKPVLFSLIGAGGLVMYMLFKGKGSGSSAVSSTGQSTDMTNSLSGLEDAIKTLAANSNGAGLVGGIAGSGDPTGSTSGNNTGSSSYNAAMPTTPTDTSVNVPVGSTYHAPLPPTRGLIPGSNGSAGGGGGGTGQVIHPTSYDPTVYGGVTAVTVPVYNPPTKLTSNVGAIPVAAGGGGKSVAYKPAGSVSTITGSNTQATVSGAGPKSVAYKPAAKPVVITAAKKTTGSPSNTATGPKSAAYKPGAKPVTTKTATTTTVQVPHQAVL